MHIYSFINNSPSIVFENVATSQITVPTCIRAVFYNLKNGFHRITERMETSVGNYMQRNILRRSWMFQKIRSKLFLAPPLLMMFLRF